MLSVQQTKLVPTSGPSHLPFPLQQHTSPRSSQSWLLLILLVSVGSSIASTERPSLTTCNALIFVPVSRLLLSLFFPSRLLPLSEVIHYFFACVCCLPSSLEYGPQGSMGPVHLGHYFVPSTQIKAWNLTGTQEKFVFLIHSSLFPLHHPCAG